MNEKEFKKYLNGVVGWMYFSMVVWFMIIIYQFFVGLITLVFGYGLGTLAIMGYNIFGVVRYIKNISIIKKYTINEAPYLVKYFEGSITSCWIFMGINLVLGGFLGFIGNLIDLIIAYNVKSHRNELLKAQFNTPTPEIIIDYEE